MSNEIKLRPRSLSAPPSRRKALAKRAARLAKHVAAVWVDTRSLSLQVDDDRLQTGEASLRGFIQDLLDVGAALDAIGRDDHPLFAFDDPAAEPLMPSDPPPVAEPDAEKPQKDESRPSKKPKANRPEPIQEPIGLPPSASRPQPSWEVGSRWEIDVKFGPSGFAVFDFEVVHDFGGGDDYRRVKVGRPGTLGFDPSIVEEVVKPAEVAGPREWSIELAERMTRNQLANNKLAVLCADAVSRRREEEPRWGRPQRFEVSIEIRLGTIAAVVAELRDDDADKGVWIVWPMSESAEYFDRSDFTPIASPRAMVESIALARYKVSPPRDRIQWGEPGRFGFPTAVDGKAATFRVHVERREYAGEWFVTITPPEWFGESEYSFIVADVEAERWGVEDFVSGLIDGIVNERRERKESSDQSPTRSTGKPAGKTKKKREVAGRRS